MPRVDQPGLPPVQAIAPNLGLAPGEVATVGNWLVRLGERTFEGDRLVELVVQDGTFDVASPADGILVGIFAQVDDAVAPGDILGTIRRQDHLQDH